jgi:hypothetical protein
VGEGWSVRFASVAGSPRIAVIAPIASIAVGPVCDDWSLAGPVEHVQDPHGLLRWPLGVPGIRKS